MRIKTSSLLKKVGINPDELVLLITAEKVMENLMEVIEENCPGLKINKMTKEDIVTLLHSYSNCVINYHPENYHQERAALLENFEMLMKYGLTEEDYDSIDFC